MSQKAIILEGSRVIREYSLEVHGENYQALARQFATKFAALNYHVVFTDSPKEEPVVEPEAPKAEETMVQKAVKKVRKIASRKAKED